VKLCKEKKRGEPWLESFAQRTFIVVSAERAMFGPNVTISVISVEVMDICARVVPRGNCKRAWG
jgi:hypothetical protein